MAEVLVAHTGNEVLVQSMVQSRVQDPGFVLSHLQARCPQENGTNNTQLFLADHQCSVVQWNRHCIVLVCFPDTAEGVEQAEGSENLTSVVFFSL